MAANLARHSTNKRLLVLVDDSFAGWARALEGLGIWFIRFSPEAQKLPGYLRIMESYLPSLREGEVRVTAGLDTVFMKNVDWLWEKPAKSPYLALPRWPWKRQAWDADFSNAVACYDEGGRQALWERFQARRKRSPWNSEMEMVRDVHASLGSVQIGTTDSIASYPMQISPPSVKWEAASYHEVGPDVGDYDLSALRRASVVYFHEEPKQDTLPPTDPVRVEWEACGPRSTTASSVTKS